MSLDVYLEEMRPVDVYRSNITHNLVPMAEAAGIYKEVWRPEECGITTANQLIPILTKGILELESDRVKYEKFNPENDWGDYDGFLNFLRSYLNACVETPTATVKAWR